MASDVRHLERGACRLGYRVEGHGAPLVLVHAGIADGRMWAPQLPSFTPHHRVVRPDLRGFGETVRPGEPFAHHEDLVALLDHLAIERAPVVGASLGGRVALDLCLEHPDRVGALVLIGSALGGHELSDPWVHARWKEADEAFAAGDREAAARIELETWLAGPHRSLDDVRGDLVGRLRAMLLRSYELDVEAEERGPTPPAAERLGEVRVPTLVVVGALDVPDMHAIAERLATGIPGARRLVLEGAAHLPNLEVPAALDRAVLEFLRAAGAAAPPR